MRKHALILALLAPLGLACPALAQWPLVLRENLPVAADSTLREKDPIAIPFPDGSTLVVFWHEDLGNCYQIITGDGQLTFSQPQQLIVGPAQPEYYAKVAADGCGGAVLGWTRTDNGPSPGTYAQRLDSLGNRLWGDTGVFVDTISSGDFDICSDGMGGMYAAVSYNPPGSTFAYIRLQRVSSSGEVPWGLGGRLVCNLPTEERYPRLAPDDLGGCYVVWDDRRPPYAYNGAIFRQRFNADGNDVWVSNGLFTCPGGETLHQIIPDGRNGFLLHSNTSGEHNTVFRIAPNGNILWSQDYVSWYSTAEIVSGELGFFYLGFVYGYDAHVYGQRIDLNGRIYWPTWGSGRVGAPMMVLPGWGCGVINFAYHYPYFYAAASFVRMPNYRPYFLNFQKMDSVANRQFGMSGIRLTYYPVGPSGGGFEFQNLNIVPDGWGGAAAIWNRTNGGLIWDIYAKHVNADGSLGPPPPAPPARPAAPANQRQTLSVSQNLIRYELPTTGRISLALYNLLGQQVAVLEEGEHIAGSYTVPLNLDHLPSGIYLLRLTTPSEAQTAKVAVVR